MSGFGILLWIILNAMSCGRSSKKNRGDSLSRNVQSGDIGDVYLWIALDQKTRCIPSYMLGKRSADMARRFMVDLASRLTFPQPQQWGRDTFETAAQVSTDGFWGYPEAVDLAFGPYVKFGTLIKDYRNASQRTAYTPAEMVGSQRRPRRGMQEDEKWSICTSHVERTNLTVRTFMKRFTRLALGFSKKLANLEAAVNLHMADYNFCWRPGKMRVTPAMAAGVTRRLWSFNDLMAQ